MYVLHKCFIKCTVIEPLVMTVLILQNGWSPLMASTYKGHLDIVKSLIEAGSNVHQTNKVGRYKFVPSMFLICSHTGFSPVSFVSLAACACSIVYTYICLVCCGMMT